MKKIVHTDSIGFSTLTPSSHQTFPKPQMSSADHVTSGSNATIGSNATLALIGTIGSNATIGELMAKALDTPHPESATGLGIQPGYYPIDPRETLIILKDLGLIVRVVNEGTFLLGDPRAKEAWVFFNDSPGLLCLPPRTDFMAPLESLCDLKVTPTDREVTTCMLVRMEALLRQRHLARLERSPVLCVDSTLSRLSARLSLPFTFCKEVLHFSEGPANLRVQAIVVDYCQPEIFVTGNTVLGRTAFFFRKKWYELSTTAHARALGIDNSPLYEAERCDESSLLFKGPMGPACMPVRCFPPERWLPAIEIANPFDLPASVTCDPLSIWMEMTPGQYNQLMAKRATVEEDQFNEVHCHNFKNPRAPPPVIVGAPLLVLEEQREGSPLLVLDGKVLGEDPLHCCAHNPVVWDTLEDFPHKFCEHTGMWSRLCLPGAVTPGVARRAQLLHLSKQLLLTNVREEMKSSGFLDAKQRMEQQIAAKKAALLAEANNYLTLHKQYTRANFMVQRMTTAIRDASRGGIVEQRLLMEERYTLEAIEIRVGIAKNLFMAMRDKINDIRSDCQARMAAIPHLHSEASARAQISMAEAMCLPDLSPNMIFQPKPKLEGRVEITSPDPFERAMEVRVQAEAAAAEAEAADDWRKHHPMDRPNLPPIMIAATFVLDGHHFKGPGDVWPGCPDPVVLLDGLRDFRFVQEPHSKKWRMLVLGSCLPKAAVDDAVMRQLAARTLYYRVEDMLKHIPALCHVHPSFIYYTVFENKHAPTGELGIDDEDGKPVGNVYLQGATCGASVGHHQDTARGPGGKCNGHHCCHRVVRHEIADTHLLTRVHPYAPPVEDGDYKRLAYREGMADSTRASRVERYMVPDEVAVREALPELPTLGPLLSGCVCDPVCMDTSAEHLRDHVHYWDAAYSPLAWRPRAKHVLVEKAYVWKDAEIMGECFCASCGCVFILRDGASTACKDHHLVPVGHDYRCACCGDSYTPSAAHPHGCRACTVRNWVMGPYLLSASAPVPDGAKVPSVTIKRDALQSLADGAVSLARGMTEEEADAGHFVGDELVKFCGFAAACEGCADFPLSHERKMLDMARLVASDPGTYLHGNWNMDPRILPAQILGALRHAFLPTALPNYTRALLQSSFGSMCAWGVAAEAGLLDEPRVPRQLALQDAAHAPSAAAAAPPRLASAAPPRLASAAAAAPVPVSSTAAAPQLGCEQDVMCSRGTRCEDIACVLVHGPDHRPEHIKMCRGPKTGGGDAACGMRPMCCFMHHDQKQVIREDGSVLPGYRLVMPTAKHFIGGLTAAGRAHRGLAPPPSAPMVGGGGSAAAAASASSADVASFPALGGGGSAAAAAASSANVASFPALGGGGSKPRPAPSAAAAAASPAPRPAPKPAPKSKP